MLRLPLVTILAREMRLKFFEVDRALGMLRVPLVTILAREMRLKIFWSRPSFGDVADVAIATGHDVGTRNAIESFSRISRANNATSRARNISLKFVEKVSIFNRIYRANIVTGGPRSTSKASFVEKLSFLAPTSWLAALAPHSLRGLHVSIFAYPAPISWRPCSQSHAEHVSVSTAMALKRSSTSCGWVYSQSRE